MPGFQPMRKGAERVSWLTACDYLTAQSDGSFRAHRLDAANHPPIWRLQGRGRTSQTAYESTEDPKYQYTLLVPVPFLTGNSLL